MVLDPRNKSEITEQDLLDMDLPRSFHKLCYKDFSSLDSYPLLEGYLKHLDTNINRGYGCFIYGAPGTGKSAKAAYIGIVARQYGLFTRWVSAVALHDAIVHRDYDQGNEQFWSYKYLTAPLLIIDDLTNEWEAYRRPGFIVQFLTDRIHAGRATIITCPVGSLETLEERKIYPPQLVSKIRINFYPFISLDQFPPMPRIAEG